MVKDLPASNGSRARLKTEIEKWRQIFDDEFKLRYAVNPREKRICYKGSERYIADKGKRREHFRNEQKAIHQILDRFSKRTRCYILYACTPAHYGQVETAEATVFWSQPLNIVAPDYCRAFQNLCNDIFMRIEDRGHIFNNMEMSNEVAQAIHTICTSICDGSITQELMEGVLHRTGLTGLMAVAADIAAQLPNRNDEQNEDPVNEINGGDMDNGDMDDGDVKINDKEENDEEEHNDQYIGSPHHLQNMAYYGHNGSGRRRAGNGSNEDADRFGDQNHNHNFVDREYQRDGSYRARVAPNQDPVNEINDSDMDVSAPDNEDPLNEIHDSDMDISAPDNEDPVNGMNHDGMDVNDEDDEADLVIEEEDDNEN